MDQGGETKSRAKWDWNLRGEKIGMAEIDRRISRRRDRDWRRGV